MVKSSGCAGISFEKWKALKGKAGRGWDLKCPSTAGRKKDDPRVSAGSRVISYSLEQGWLESFQAHFSIGGCQLAGAQAFRRRGFDCSVIVAMAPCPAGTPQPHLSCPPVPGPGALPKPPGAVPGALHRLDLKAPGDAMGRRELSSVNTKGLHPSVFPCIWISLHPSGTFNEGSEPGIAGSQILCSL